MATLGYGGFTSGAGPTLDGNSGLDDYYRPLQPVMLETGIRFGGSF